MPVRRVGDPGGRARMLPPPARHSDSPARQFASVGRLPWTRVGRHGLQAATAVARRDADPSHLQADPSAGAALGDAARRRLAVATAVRARDAGERRRGADAAARRGRAHPAGPVETGEHAGVDPVPFAPVHHPMLAGVAPVPGPGHAEANRPPAGTSAVCVARALRGRGDDAQQSDAHEHQRAPHFVPLPRRLPRSSRMLSSWEDNQPAPTGTWR
jgi:hypothetical protein